MGAVYRHASATVDRTVASRFFRRYRARPRLRPRASPARPTLAKLGHPNIVTLYEFGQAGDLF
jgi:serine/threonine protein kinase